MSVGQVSAPWRAFYSSLNPMGEQGGGSDALSHKRPDYFFFYHKNIESLRNNSKSLIIGHRFFNVFCFSYTGAFLVRCGRLGYGE